MPVECTFVLNHRSLSTLTCPGFGSVAAFSGNGRYTNDPSSTAVADKRPLPTGTYSSSTAKAAGTWAGSGIP
jgi:Tlde1 domain